MQHCKNKNTETVLKILAQIIREERVKQNKSQRLLADEYEIQKSMLSRLESGINEPKLFSLISICEALNIKLSDLCIKLENKLPQNFSLLDK